MNYNRPFIYLLWKDQNNPNNLSNFEKLKGIDIPERWHWPATVRTGAFAFLSGDDINRHYLRNYLFSLYGYDKHFS